MKKVTVFLCSLALVFSVVGVAGASSITYTQSPDEAIVEGFTELFSLVDSISEVTDDTISKASPEISGDEIDSDQNEDAVLEKVVANLTTGGYLGLSLSTDLYSLDNRAFRSFNNRSTFPNGNGRVSNGNGLVSNGNGLVSNGNGRVSNGNGRVSNGNGRVSNGNGVSPVPEPSTIFLLGIGLLGLVAIGRRKFKPEQ